MTKARMSLLCYVAAVVAVGVSVFTGLITNWGEWYSPSLPYRQQTEALLSGQVGLSTSPSIAELDFAWDRGQMQQVWGLGVPFWRLPFEALARLFGEPTFPDRIAFAIALGLLTLGVIRTFAVPVQTDWLAYIRDHPEGIAAVFVFVLFPPFLTLCRVRFNVYEEAVAYGYICSIGLFTGLIAFVRRPTLRGYSLIALCCGLIGFVRPTLYSYSLATLAISFFLTRTLRWSWRKSLVALPLFALGAGLLFESNRARFGSGLEFGHHLNLNGPKMLFASKFDSPFEGEAFWPAARELFASTFFASKLNGTAAYAEGIVPWQTATSRFRGFSHTTFDVLYFLGMILGWGFVIGLWLRRRRKENLLQTNPVLIIGAVWSVIAATLLAGFYLHFFCITSRYILDFAPAIATALLICIYGITQVSPGRFRIPALAALALLWGWEVGTAKVLHRGGAWSQSAVVDALRRKTPNPVTLPDHYDLPTCFPSTYHISRNGEGWSVKSGEVGHAVSLFVQDPEKVILEVQPRPGITVSDADYALIRAKIGSEFLERESITETPEGRLLTFSGAKNADYRAGIQILFLSFATSSDLAKSRPPFRLVRVDWSNASRLRSSEDALALH